MKDVSATLTQSELAAPFKIPQPDPEPMPKTTRLWGDTDGKSFRYLRYVRHHEVAAFEKKGWAVSSDLAGTHHGVYAKIMEWRGEGEPE